MKRIWCNNGTAERLIRNKNYLPAGFVLGRLNRKEAKLDKLSAKYSYEFIYDLYIVQNERFVDIIKKLGISSRDFHGLLNRYKIKKPYNLRAKNNTYVRPHEMSVKQKGRLCRSISEQRLYDCLSQEFCDLQYDVRVDDRYPFFCDFYIPSLDLFIELQAHQSHGKLPITYLNEAQYPDDRYRDVFARRDVEKYDTAVKNNINLIRIYPRSSLSKNIEINPKQFSHIVEKCFRCQR